MRFAKTKALAAAGVLALSLAACGDDSDSEQRRTGCRRR